MRPTTSETVQPAYGNKPTHSPREINAMLRSLKAVAESHGLWRNQSGSGSTLQGVRNELVYLRVQAHDDIPHNSVFAITGGFGQNRSEAAAITDDNPITRTNHLFATSVEPLVAGNCYDIHLIGTHRPHPVRYSGTAPAVGDVVGPIPGSYEVSKDYTGLRVVSDADASLNEVFVVLDIPDVDESTCCIYLAKAKEVIECGCSGEVEFWITCTPSSSSSSGSSGCALKECTNCPSGIVVEACNDWGFPRRIRLNEPIWVHYVNNQWRILNTPYPTVATAIANGGDCGDTHVGSEQSSSSSGQADDHIGISGFATIDYCDYFNVIDPAPDEALNKYKYCIEAGDKLHLNYDVAADEWIIVAVSMKERSIVVDFRENMSTHCLEAKWQKICTSACLDHVWEPVICPDPCESSSSGML